MAWYLVKHRENSTFIYIFSFKTIAWISSDLIEVLLIGSDISTGASIKAKSVAVIPLPYLQ
jgi:hypothetical protein